MSSRIHISFRHLLIKSHRVLSYDVHSGMITLLDGKDGLLVDVSLALDFQSNVWVADRLTTIMVIGDLELSDVSLNVPSKEYVKCIPLLRNRPRLIFELRQRILH